MKKKGWLMLVMSGALQMLQAQTVNEFYVETRLGWEQESLDGSSVDSHGGFRGQWLNLRLDGELAPGLTYSYRQRLNKQTDRTFFDATDWIHLTWQASEKWAFSGGKQVVAIGGYEYDRAPIDLYYCSEFWNNVPCYQVGVSAAYRITPSDQLLLQVCNTPFRSWTGNGKYALNLMWTGSHGWWETMWSVNYMQNVDHTWMNYISLGQRFRLSPTVAWEVDVMNRAGKGQDFLGQDLSVATEMSWQSSPACRIFWKYTYDVNHTGTDMDRLVHDGTELNLVSAGVEVNPLKNGREQLRFFAAGAYSWGQNGNPDGTIQDRQLRLMAGVKFRLDILRGVTRWIKTQ